MRFPMNLPAAERLRGARFQNDDAERVVRVRRS